MDQENRRLEVYELLKKASSHKLMRSGSRDALSIIDEAYKLTFNNEGVKLLLDPFPALVSYRKALVLLRQNTQSDDVLEEVDSLLVAAASDESLGPWPRLYRLPVIQRLVQNKKAKSSHMKIAFKMAIGAVQVALAEKNSQHHKNVIQHELFNAIELCGIFLNIDYDNLDGLGAKLLTGSTAQQDLFWGIDDGKSLWSLVGQSNLTSQVLYPRRLALKELESRVKELTENKVRGIVFTVEQGRSSFQYISASESKLLEERDAYILAYLLREQDQSIGPLRAILAEKLDVTDSTLRVIINRLKEKLSAPQNRHSIDNLEYIRSLLLLGAVNMSFYSRFGL